jgi:hypothetical protein
MLKLSEIIEIILINEYWDSFDLEMTKNGFERLKEQLSILDYTRPQVYVHVIDEGPFKNKVARIGKSESGILYRWIDSIDGHQATFLWAIGESNTYGEKNAQKYPSYLLFFSLLYELKTKLYVLSCQKGHNGKSAARSAEEALIGHFLPLWESYKRAFKKQRDFDLKELSKYGGALNKLMSRNESLLSFLTKKGVVPEDIGDFALSAVQQPVQPDYEKHRVFFTHFGAGG